MLIRPKIVRHPGCIGSAPIPTHDAKSRPRSKTSPLPTTATIAGEIMTFAGKDLDQLATGMCPADGQLVAATGAVVRDQRVTSGVSVNLHNTTGALQYPFRSIRPLTG